MYGANANYNGRKSGCQAGDTCRKGADFPHSSRHGLKCSAPFVGSIGPDGASIMAFAMCAAKRASAAKSLTTLIPAAGFFVLLVGSIIRLLEALKIFRRRGRN